jgi:hypothetical protein
MVIKGIAQEISWVLHMYFGWLAFRNDIARSLNLLEKPTT